MIDLETWSTQPNALIVSIGACMFDPKGADVGERFYAAIEPASMPGRHVDTNTILWWMSPERTAAREAWLAERKVDAYSALTGLSRWVRDQQVAVESTEDIRVWGNGAAFDNVILASAYRSLGTDPFWDHRNDRCYRTLKALTPQVRIQRSGTHHNALDDAVDQARHLQRIRAALSLVL
jgi:exodeoxyribonuclease VIII